MNSDKNINDIKINVPTEYNELIKKALKNINSNDEIKTLWIVVNVNATERTNYSDHGPVHIQIVANIALKIARMLKKEGIQLSVEKDYNLSYEHGELVIMLGSFFHDLGMSVNREGHEEFSLFIANKVLHDVLDFLPVYEKTIVISETLHTIISHRSGGSPNTLEAGIVRLADALDMTQGRSRLPFEAGNIEIFNLSETAVDSVEILKGDKKAIQVLIKLNNSAGIFGIDQLLRKKLKGSGLESYVSIKAVIEREQEKNLIKEFNL